MGDGGARAPFEIPAAEHEYAASVGGFFPAICQIREPDEIPALGIAARRLGDRRSFSRRRILCDIPAL